jgi:Glycosyl transferase family 64 domain
MAFMVSAKLLKCVLMGVLLSVIFLAFWLQMTIMRQHRELHLRKLEKFGLTPFGEKRKPVHYEGEEDTGYEVRHDGHADDHEHADEDPHLHSGGEGDMVLDYQLPSGFQHMLERAKKMKQHCDELNLPEVDQTLLLQNANITTDLPAFGIIHALESYRPKTRNEATQWNCQLPPETECAETQFTVIFMGYRPDRLAKFKLQVHRMTQLNQEVWNGIIKEVVLVWNGDRELSTSQAGRKILEWAADTAINFRIFFPLKEGFPNDLMNRYHPRFGISTKAVLLYDDDGPFYGVQAVTSGFELWKRNANAEIGAMARRLDVANRAQTEKDVLPRGERQWVSNCRAVGDTIRYNFQHFAQTGANMALPSGSFLHRDFMCFLWHPVMEEIRQFVRAHPVHPDDVTVSTIVSHVSGRAPKVYSRRLNKADALENTTDADSGDTSDEPQDILQKPEESKRLQIHNSMRRRLLWDDGNHGVWAKKRESAVNSLLGYFGSLNSGSDGWCYGTPYHDKIKNVCVPDQARVGMLNWMAENNDPLQCPEYRTITKGSVKD